VLELYILNTTSGHNEVIDTKDNEASIVCVSGKVVATIVGVDYSVAQGDGLYVPRGTKVIIEGTSERDQLVIAMAEAWSDADIIYTSLGDAWREKETHGKYNFTRDVANLLHRQDRASRLVTGITVGQDGLWTSWPPHHHSDSLEEIYFYYDIPTHGFGVHIGMLMDGTEQAEIVRSGDAVIVPNGYHPTVATPGTRMKYVWFLGAKHTESDRQAKSQDHPQYF
jgi:5-deoxy-glucuronate isomerase